MLESYEAIYEDGQIKWLGEPPTVRSARAIVVLLEPLSDSTPKRTPPPHLAGRIRIKGDIVSSMVDEEDWESLK